MAEEENVSQWSSRNCRSNLPNVVRFEPDIGQGDRPILEQRGSDQEEDVLEWRHEDAAPISFRHFLSAAGARNNNRDETSSNVATVPARESYACAARGQSDGEHSPSCSLSTSSAAGYSHRTLPDFVRDHLESSWASSSPNVRPQSQTSCRMRARHAERQHYEPATFSSSEWRQLPQRDAPLGFRRQELPLDLTSCSRSYEPVSSDPNPDPQASPDPNFDIGNGPRYFQSSSTNHIHRCRHQRVSPNFDAESASHLEQLEYFNRELSRENNSLQTTLYNLHGRIHKQNHRIRELEDLVAALEISKVEKSCSSSEIRTNQENAAAMAVMKSDEQKEEANVSSLKAGGGSGGRAASVEEMKKMVTESELAAKKLYEDMSKMRKLLEEENHNDCKLEESDTTDVSIANADKEAEEEHTDTSCTPKKCAEEEDKEKDKGPDSANFTDCSNQK